MDTLQTIYNHHLWANLRLFEACLELTEAQLDASIPGVYGTIRDTLRHIAGAEQSYLSRISTGLPFQHPKDGPPKQVSVLIELIKTNGAGFIEWAQKVQAGDSVEINWDGELRQVPKTIILNQVINHATEHRSQVMTMLTQIGIEPPDVSSWSYFDARDA